jgi:hypothetical protein
MDPPKSRTKKQLSISPDSKNKNLFAKRGNGKV